MSKIKLLLNVVDDLRTLANSVQAVADAMMQSDAPPPAEETKPADPPAAPAKTVTLEEVRAVLAAKSHEGLTAEVRELLGKYGAKKLSAVDPKDYAALLADAEVLTHAS